MSPSTRLPRRGPAPGRTYSPEERAELVQRFDSWALAQTRVAGRFWESHCFDAVGVGDVVAKGLIKDRIANGVLEQCGDEAGGYRVPGQPLDEIVVPEQIRGLRWTPEQEGAALTRLLDWASLRTTERGFATIEEAADALGHSYRRASSLVMQGRDSGKLAEVGRGLGFVRVGVPSALIREMKTKEPEQEAPEQPEKSETRDELKSRANAWGRVECRRQSISIERLAAHLGVSRSVADSIATELEAAGVLIRQRSRFGLVWKDEAHGEAKSLSDLVAIAKASVDLTRKRSSGRRSTTEEYDPSVLTPSQLKDVRTVAHLVAEGVQWDLHLAQARTEARQQGSAFGVTEEDHLYAAFDSTQASKRLSEVSVAFFTRDERDVKWTIEADIVRWSERRARSRFLDKGGAAGDWHPRMDSLSVAKHQTSIRLLLNLCVASSAIRRAPAPSPWLVRMAPGWNEALDEWHLRIVALNQGRNAQTLRAGLSTLATYATREGSTEPKTTHWGRVRIAIERDERASRGLDRKERLLAPKSMAIARHAYGLLLRGGLVIGEPWPKPKRKRGLFSASALTLLADSAGAHRRAPLDLSGFVLANGTVPHALLEGRCGLRRLVDWFTLSAAELEDNGLPPREYAAAGEDQKRRQWRAHRATDKKPYRLKRVSLTNRLNRLNCLLGWAVAHSSLGFNPVTDDLQSLLSDEVLKEYAYWLSETLDWTVNQDAPTFPSMVIHTMNDCAIIADPFLHAAAYMEALARGESASCAAACAGEHRKKGDRLRQLVNDCRAEAKKERDEIVKAWAGTETEPAAAWTQLNELVNLHRGTISHLANGLTIHQQIEALKTAASAATSSAPQFAPTEDWACAVRAAVVVNVLRKIPLRARSLIEMRLEHWKNTAVDDARQTTEPHKWEGAIHLELPGDVMKSGKMFRPRYVTRTWMREKSDRGTCRDLLELYFMPGGARDWLLTIPADGSREAERVSSDYVFPAMARRVAQSWRPQSTSKKRATYRWSQNGVAKMFRNVVLAHATELGIRRSVIRRLRGALGIHVVRLLYGTFWATSQGLLGASLMLQHSNTEITRRLYCTVDERDIQNEV